MYIPSPCLAKEHPSDATQHFLLPSSFVNWRWVADYKKNLCIVTIWVSAQYIAWFCQALPSRHIQCSRTYRGCCERCPASPPGCGPHTGWCGPGWTKHMAANSGGAAVGSETDAQHAWPAPGHGPWWEETQGTAEDVHKRFQVRLTQRGNTTMYT